MRARPLQLAALAATAFAFFAVCATATPIQLKIGPNIVTNGGFENTSAIAGSGWTASGFIGENFDYYIDTVPADAHSGTHSFAGGGIGVPGFLSQTLATIPGANYSLSFWLANFGGFTPNEFTVSVGGVQLLDRVDILQAPYSMVTLAFRATSAATSLQFGFRNDASYLNLDDVSVMVPEPATLLLLGVGLALLGVANRRIVRA